jgi:hypothetical protein
MTCSTREVSSRTRAKRARFEQRLGIRRQAFEGERARLRVHRRTDARYGGGEPLVREGIDEQRQGLSDLHPGCHALGNLGEQLQRVHAHDGHDRHLRFHQLANRDHPLLDISVKRGTDGCVTQLALGQLQGRAGRVDVSPEILGLLQRGVIGGALEPQRRLRVIARLLRDELTFVQFGRALKPLLRLRHFGGRSPHVGRVFDPWQVVRLCGTILREGTRVRGALLVEVVLQLLAIELDERLSRRHTITEIGEHTANDAVDFGGHRDLVFGSQRADDVEGSAHRFLTDGFGLDGLGGSLRPTRLFRAWICTSGDSRNDGCEHDKYDGGFRHEI